VGRRFGGHVALLTQYAYLHYTGAFQGTGSRLSQSALRISVVWTPSSGSRR
jgi:hypothetical protein